jgi:hypothetical protein
VNWYIAEIKRLTKAGGAKVAADGADRRVTWCPFVDGARGIKRKGGQRLAYPLPLFFIKA